MITVQVSPTCIPRLAQQALSAKVTEQEARASAAEARLSREMKRLNKQGQEREIFFEAETVSQQRWAKLLLWFSPCCVYRLRIFRHVVFLFGG